MSTPLNIPPISVLGPQTFFNLLETYFKCNNISADTDKFCKLGFALPEDFIIEISDIINDPDENTLKYECAKQRIFAKYSLTTEQKIQKLIAGVETHNKSPSQILQQIKSLSKGTIDDPEAIKNLWMMKLPVFIKAILASRPEDSVDQLAVLADSIQRNTQTNSLTSECDTTSIPQSSSTESELRKLLKEATDELARLKLEKANARQTDQMQVPPWEIAINSLRQEFMRNSTSRNRSRSRRRFHSRNRGRSDSRNRFCYYHTKFGAKAIKCVQPCSWKSSGNEQVGE